MKRRIAFIAWLTASLIVLGWWHYCFGSNPDLSRTLRNESQIYLLIGMTVLSFPLGLLYVYLFGFAVSTLDVAGINVHQHEMAEVFLTWTGFVLTGYLQWFVLFPFIRKKLHARRVRNTMHF